MKNTLFNLAFGINCLLVFLVLYDKTLVLPDWLQVVGRMHPLLLHFPIVLVIAAAFHEIFLLKSARNSQKNIHNQTGNWILVASAFTASLSALAGLLLSQEEGYHTGMITWHKWTGIVVSLATLAWFGFINVIRASKLRSLFMSGLCFAAIIMAGHQGANITHGVGFLTAPIQSQNEKMPVNANDAMVFEHVIKPILEKKCLNCHNSQKSKGGLVMETPEQLLKGGENGPLWDLAAADMGQMMRNIQLPMDDEKHMPPAGKPQLTNDEIAILYHWIKGGSNFQKKVTELADNDTLKILAQSRLKPNDTEVYTFKPAADDIIKKMSTNYRVITPLALGSPALCVDFFGASHYNSQQLTDLQAIKTQIVDLNLNKMPIQDGDLETIAGFENLRKLNLSFTPVSGSKLRALKALTHLRELSLSGIRVQSADLDFLKEMPALKKLQLWNTGTGEQEIAALRVIMTGTAIESGFNGDTIVARLSIPILEDEEIKVIRRDTNIVLKHYVRGSVIRYTLDGSDPDSLASPVYQEGGILINGTMTLKAKAFLDGWISSDILEQQYYKAGFMTDSVRLAQQPNPQYSDKGKALFDGKMGDSNFRTGRWLGFRETSCEAYVYFDRPITLSQVTFSTLVDINSYIMPASSLEVWGGSNPKDLVLLKTIKPQQPTQVDPPIKKGYQCRFNPKQVKIVKLVGKSVQKLPAWHPGKGDKGWFFVDEVFLN